MAKTKQAWKIPPARIQSDDCAVYVGREIVDGEITNQGTPYYVHAGEWVELHPCRSLKEIMALSSVAAASTDGLHVLCAQLAKRLVAWDWTGMDGEPLPPPSVDVLEELTDDEVMWLLSAAQGAETSVERKNG